MTEHDEQQTRDADLTDQGPPPEVSVKRREFWVGIFVLVGLLSILAALLTFTAPSTFRRRYVVTTVVADAGGVRRGDPVQLRGVTVGRIQGFELVHDGVAVRLEIDHAYKIPADSHVEFSTNSLLGGVVAQIAPGESSEPAVKGTVLEGRRARPFTSEVGRVAAESQKLFERLQAVLSDKTIEGIEGSTEELHLLLGQLTDLVTAQRADVEQMTRSLRHAAHNLDSELSAPELDRALRRLDPLTQKLDEAASSLDKSSRSLEVVLGRIERGEGTLGRLSKDDRLYANTNAAVVSLNETSAQVQMLVKDLRANPKKYVHISVF